MRVLIYHIPVPSQLSHSEILTFQAQTDIDSSHPSPPYKWWISPHLSTDFLGDGPNYVWAVGQSK